MMSRRDPCAVAVHVQYLKHLRPYTASLQSRKTCLCCLHKVPEKVLSCGHCICDNCVRILGKPKREERHSFELGQCPLCGQQHADGPLRFLLPTAGIRLLALDGGGVRGIIPLIILSYVEEWLRPLGMPLSGVLDYVCGTSAGIKTV